MLKSHDNVFSRTLGAFLLLLRLMLGGFAQAEGAVSSTEAVHERWVDSASAGLDPQAVQTLQRIHGADQRLLALRAYLRAGDSLAERWSWSRKL